jgi:hypothetical protein
MTREKIENAATLASGLLLEAYSSAESLIEISGILSKIQDDYVLINRADADELLKLLRVIAEYDNGDPPLAERRSYCLYLKERLEAAILEN